ncbi:tRNA (guanosine(37)-N1)-methyltransferase TrmD, partial [Arthrospira platensis SPKY2]
MGLHNIRDYAPGKHRVTDEPPYGGGGGMVLKAEPIFTAVESILPPAADIPIILLTPQGELFNHALAQELAQEERLLLLCGRYEGVDERVRSHLVTREISIG